MTPMTKILTLFCACASLLLSGCSTRAPTTAPPIPQTFYQVTIADPQTGQILSVRQLAERLSTMDVVVIGEHHGHQGAHLLQSRLQAALHERHPQQILSMEQFTVEHQQALDHYLAGETGEAEMMEDADAWPNYEASYRPLVEYAKVHQLPVIAANAPGDIVRCIGRKGADYLDTLTEEERRYIPQAPFFSTDAYREKFFETMGGGRHGSESQELLENAFRAQLLRDNTMASRVLEGRSQHPEHQVIHVNGTFHSEGRLGMVASLLQREPDLSVAVISPVFVDYEAQTLPLTDNRDKGDYLYFLLPFPEKYQDSQRQQEAMKERFRSSANRTCG